MFRPRGLFKQVPCPDGINCGLQNCIFKHDGLSIERHLTDRDRQETPALVDTNRSDPPPPLKRKHLSNCEAPDQDIKQIKKPRLGSTDLSTFDTPDIKHNLPTPKPAIQSKLPPNHSVNGNLPSFKNTDSTSVRPTNQSNATNRVLSNNSLEPLQSQTRSISPPATNVRIPDRLPPLPADSKQVKVEKLHPRKVQRDPVPFPTRVNCLQKLHQRIEETNKKILQESPTQKPFFLSEQEIIKQALDAEEVAANSNSSGDGYKQTLMSRMIMFKNMALPRWNVWVSDEVRNIQSTVTESSDNATNGKIITGLANPSQEVAIVKYLRSGLKQAEQFGYVLRRPTDGETAASRKQHNGGIEECDRCSTHFQVFPGRNAEGKLASKGPCRYHWARAPPAKFTKNSVYDCCGASIGSEGCTLSENHVFKVNNPARLAALWQFETSPTPNDNKKHKWPVTFDCEMCYTTKGMELVRVTAISWPEKKLLLDILVQPFGDILDLNTRFSGVSQHMYLDAPKYGTFALSTSPQPHDTPPRLERVASPLAARQLLFDLIDTETPLIGHAIDNDLNACRIIHPFVIDTVIMYPHPRGLPARYKLKDLAKKYLHRVIQNNSEAGHDSREDSEATGDLVLVRVAEKWAEYKSKGWHWDGDVLVTSSKKTIAKV